MVINEEYKTSLSEFRNTLIGRLVLSKGDSLVAIKTLKVKLSALWSIHESSWKITLLGNGFFSLDLKTIEVRNELFAKVAMFLKPGLLHISK